ncbi:unnamed protein product, partial [Candidula unifasciata]
HGARLQLSRLIAILVKKALVTWRSRIITLVQLALPGLFTFLVMLSEQANKEDLRELALTLNIVPFGETYIPFTDGHTAKGTLVADLYKRQFCNCHNTEYIRLKDVSVYFILSFSHFTFLFFFFFFNFFFKNLFSP